MQVMPVENIKMRSLYAVKGVSTDNLAIGSRRCAARIPLLKGPRYGVKRTRKKKISSGSCFSSQYT